MNKLKNKVQLLGRLGMAPEVRTTEKGHKMAKLNLATNETYKNGQGEQVTDTQWHQVIAWGKTAEIAEKYLQKGQEILVEGRITYRDYLDKSGQKKFITEIQATELLMLEKNKPVEKP